MGLTFFFKANICLSTNYRTDMVLFALHVLLHLILIHNELATISTHILLMTKLNDKKTK